MAKKSSKNWKKKAAVGATCAAASAGVLVGGLFDSPADLLNGVDAPTPVVMTVTDSGDDGGATAQNDEQKRRTPAAAMRRWVLSLPWGVRALVGVPLWAVGWVILGALSLLWSAALTPVGSLVVSWLVVAALVIGVFALTAKAMFPHVPMKKILRPRNVLIITSGVCLLGAANVIVPLFWEGYGRIGQIIQFAGSTTLLGAACISFGVLHHRLQKRKAALAAPVKTARTAVEQKAMALADSVCERRIYRGDLNP